METAIEHSELNNSFQYKSSILPNLKIYYYLLVYSGNDANRLFILETIER